jgi:hypothetical protein
MIQEDHTFGLNGQEKSPNLEIGQLQTESSQGTGGYERGDIVSSDGETEQYSES